MKDSSLRCTFFLLIAILILRGPGHLFASGMSSTNFQIRSYSLNGGGHAPALTESGAGSMILGSSLAQEVPIGKSNLSSYENLAGFWYNETGSSTDTDGDGIPDDLDNDDDNDGLLDIYETDTRVYVSPTDTGTDPLIADTDGDTHGDGNEVVLGSDPNSDVSVPDYEPGDIAPLGTPDGIVDTADAMIAMRMASGLLTPTQVDLARGDVAPLSGSDRKIDIADALLIMRKASGLTSF